MKIAIFGLGYSGVAVAQAAQKAGFSVMGTCRSQERADQLKGQGIEAILCDELRPEHFEGVTHVLSTIAPQAGADIALPLIPNPQPPIPPYWLGYLSTTGVYGDWKVAWVDEGSELRGDTPRLKARIAAEGAWRARGGHVFRLAGIYGPGRSVLEDIAAGTARRIDKPGQVFSRIHVEDIAQVVVASMLKPEPGAVYNLCDDEAASAREVVEYGCALLGAKLPPLVAFEEAQLSEMAREFYSANRRVRNERVKKELGVRLLYPTYREGLQALIRKVNVA